MQEKHISSKTPPSGVWATARQGPPFMVSLASYNRPDREGRLTLLTYKTPARGHAGSKLVRVVNGEGLCGAVAIVTHHGGKTGIAGYPSTRLST
jgi:hypothetical protein